MIDVTDRVAPRPLLANQSKCWKSRPLADVDASASLVKVSLWTRVLENVIPKSRYGKPFGKHQFGNLQLVRVPNHLYRFFATNE